MKYNIYIKCWPSIDILGYGEGAEIFHAAFPIFIHDNFIHRSFTVLNI